jgi:hypothetical protein
MHRRLTGYATAFNRRYPRCGQLYENSYKSIVCEEDAHFKELVRHNHLNPMRRLSMDLTVEIGPSPAKTAKEPGGLTRRRRASHAALCRIVKKDPKLM